MFSCGLAWKDLKMMQRKGDWIRVCISISGIFSLYASTMNTLKNDAESARCKGNWIRGCVSISDLSVCIDPLWMILKFDAETARCKGHWIVLEDVYQCLIS